MPTTHQQIIDLETRFWQSMVDDDTANLEVLGDLLRSEGYTVVCARNGAEAMACLGNAQPDVVMLDYVMPTMDGATVAKKLKDDDATRRIAIVMTSRNRP